MKAIKVELMSKKDNKQSAQTFIVASTKSKNNLVDALKVDYFVNTLDKEDKDFYIDRESALESAKTLALTLVGGEETEQNKDFVKLMQNAIISALETACIVKRVEKE